MSLAEWKLDKWKECSIGFLVVCKAYNSAVCDAKNMVYGMSAITTPCSIMGMVLGPATMGGIDFLVSLINVIETLLIFVEFFFY